MTNFSIGTNYEINGKKVNLQSDLYGINVKEVVDLSVKPYDLKINKIKDKVSLTNNQILEYANLSNQFSLLKEAADKLRGPGVSALDDDYNSLDVFRTKKVELTTNDNSNPFNYVNDVKASLGSENGIHTLKVTNVATSHLRYSLTSFNSLTNAIAYESPIIGQFGTGELEINGQTIEINEGDNLQQIVAKINSHTNSTNVKASTFRNGPSSYVLRLDATKTGLDNNFFIIDPDGILTNITWNDVPGVNSNIELDGINITFDSNVIDLGDFRVNLKSETPANTKIIMEINNDYFNIIRSVENLVNVVNNFLDYCYKQTETENINGVEKLKSDSYLGHDQDFKNMIREFKSVIKSLASTSNNQTIFYIDQIGVKSNVESATDILTKEKFSLDQTILADSLLNYFNEVKNLLGFSFTVANDSLVFLSRTGEHSANDFELDVNLTRMPIIDGITQDQRVMVTKINGNNKNNLYAKVISLDDKYYIDFDDIAELKGLSFRYEGPNASNVVLNNMSEGIAEKIFKIAVSYVGNSKMGKSNNGLINNKLDRLTEQANEHGFAQNNLQLMRDKKMDLEIDKWSRIAKEVKKSQQTIDFLEAQNKERTK